MISSPPVQQLRYRAFISYSHAADSQFAPILQATIERLGKPWYRRRALNTFRDDTDLAATPQLWPKIEASLADSGYFLLLASPEAAASEGVNREIKHWTQTLGRDRQSVLIVLTGGTIVWDDQARDFDWTKTTALPASFGSYFSGGAQPLWADFSQQKVQHRREVDDVGFRKAALKVAAALHGMAPRDLESADLQQHRRTIRTFGSFVAGLVLLLIAAVSLFIDARHQRNEADRRARVAQSRALAVQAMDRSDKQLELSLLLSVESGIAADTFESRKALLEGILASGHIRRFLPGGEGTQFLLFHDVEPKLIALSKDAVSVWDLQAGGPPVELAPKGEGLKAAVFFDSGKTLAVASSDGTLRVWDFASRKLLATIAARDSVAPGPGPPGPILPVEVDSRILLWDLTARAVRGAIPIDEGETILAMAANRSGSLVALSIRESGLKVWDVAMNRFLDTHFKGQGGLVNGLAFSPDSRLLATGSVDESVILWDVKTGIRRRWWPKSGNWVMRVQFSPDGRFLAWVSGSEVLIFDQKEDRFLDEPRLGMSYIDSLAFSGDSRSLAVAGWGRIGLVDLSEGSPLINLRPEHKSWIIGAGFNPAGDLAVSISGHEIVVWDAAQKVARSRATSQARLTGALAFSPDGRTLLTCSETGEILAWRLSDSAVVPAGTYATGSPEVRAVAFRPDGKGFVAGDSGGRLLAWESASPPGSLPKELAAVGCKISDLSFSLNGESIATGCSEGEIHVVDRTGRVHQPFKLDSNNVVGVRFSADGNRLFSAGSPGIASWDPKSGNKIGTPLDLHQSGANSFDLSPAAKMMATTSTDGWLALWDLETLSLLGRIHSHVDSFHSVAFAPNGKLLIAGSGGSTYGNDALMFIDVDSESWRRHACSIASRKLTEDEWHRYLMSAGPLRESCSGAP